MLTTPSFKTISRELLQVCALDEKNPEKLKLNDITNGIKRRADSIF